MSGQGHPGVEMLEACARNEAGERAQEIDAHVKACSGCAQELAWLRREQQLFSARASLPGENPLEAEAALAKLWSGVAARIAPDARESIAAQAQAAAPARGLISRWRRSLSWVALALPAAAVLALLVRPAKPLPGLAPSAAVLADDSDDAPDPRVALALHKAEADTANAVAVLEKEAADLRPQMPASEAKTWDASLRAARERLDAARLASAEDDGDVNSQLRVLDGYSRYLRSLQQMVKDTEESRP